LLFWYRKTSGRHNIRVLLLQFLKIKKKALAFKRRKSYLYPFDCKFLREATGILWDVEPV
jgi:hypothetical protein